MMRLYQIIGNEMRADGTRELPPEWVIFAYNDFRKMITDPRNVFPCYFGVIAENKGFLRYSFLDPSETLSPIPLKNALLQYLHSYKSIPGKSALIIFVGNAEEETIDEYESNFWKILQGLHDIDEYPWPRHIPSDPEDPRWEYCLGGEPWFITGHSPMHHKRGSRYSKNGLMMVMQPTANLKGIVGDGPIAAQIRKEIRSSLRNYDRIGESPDLWRSGDPTVLEWKQYWFNDSNMPNLKQCPLRIRPARIEDSVS